ncbi:MAG: dihydrodipicolinate reductase [Deltaproteobacteria bacterium]|nr:dihydrodipicolinate reductase [Deltaproteobacteria bacterium]
MVQALGPLPVAVVGLGFIGRKIAEAALASPDLTLVAAVDLAASLSGRSLSDIVPGAPRSVKVDRDLGLCLPKLRGGVVLLATGSRFEAQLQQLEAAVRAGAHVVSTCEELAFPWLRFEEKADKLDQLAVQHKVSVLGTGVNPGFVLDRLVATAGGACGSVRHAKASRVVDLLTCRESLQRRAGLGLTEDEFERRAAAGELGHVGLAESAALCALGLGLDFDEYEEELEPLLADEDLGGRLPLKKGQVAGVWQRVRGFHEERQTVELELTLAADAEGPHDEIHLDAEPPVRLRIEGGYAEDSATAWALVNAAPRVAAAEPGLLTVLELPAGR